MKVTIVGCGDAWGGGGRSHTCFRLDMKAGTLLVDFGASSIVSWHRLGFSTNDIDAIVLSHLHGDHFGGIPFLLLHAQFESRRVKPLTIIGPSGARERIERAIEVFYPGVPENGWRFKWCVEELEPGATTHALGAEIATYPVLHGGHVRASAIRVDDGSRVFAYSGDTEWTDQLLEASRDADLFVVECYAFDMPIVGHLDWSKLRENLPRLTARRVAITHMGSAMRAHASQIGAAGLEALDDGQVFHLGD